MKISLLQPHSPQHIVSRSLPVRLRHGQRLIQPAGGSQRFLQQPPDGLRGIQAAVWILKYHLGPDGMVHDISFYMMVYAQNCFRERSLATAALPHQPQTFSGPDLKIRMMDHILPIVSPEKGFQGKSVSPFSAFFLRQGLTAVLIVHGQIPHLQYRL